ncbi:MAG: glycosyltransferase, partial [Thermodesulfovibrionia bacterium]|nr:glycosyltransferase [Thermodesulfovibrionia bacterium]
LDAIKRFHPDEIFLAFFGDLDENFVHPLGFEYKSFGFLSDNISLRLLYSASDIFIAPSLMDAFGKTLIEAMACGTPVVCFDATGPKDIVTDKVDGYKAKPFEADDLANGIKWILNNEHYNKICEMARKKVVDEFDNKVVAQKYIALYKEVIQG